MTGDGAGEWGSPPQADRPPLPGDSEVVRLQTRGQAIGPKALRDPVVGAPRGRGAGQAGADDVGEVLQRRHDLGVLHRLGDECAGAGGIYGNLGLKPSGAGQGEENGGGASNHAALPD